MNKAKKSYFSQLHSLCSITVDYYRVLFRLPPSVVSNGYAFTSTASGIAAVAMSGKATKNCTLLATLHRQEPHPTHSIISSSYAHSRRAPMWYNTCSVCSLGKGSRTRSSTAKLCPASPLRADQVSAPSCV